MEYTRTCMGAAMNLEAAILARTTKKPKIVLLGNPLPIQENHMRTTKTPTPYGRKGERPKLVRSKSAAEGESIADAIGRD